MAKKKMTDSARKQEKLPFPKGITLNDGTVPPGKHSPGRPVSGDPGETAEAGYYKLKLKAVDDLVTANEENSPPVPKQEMRKYRSTAGWHLPDWLKAILLKYWFAGVICYFFVWGLSTYRLNQWDLIVILAVALGGVTYLLTKNIYRFMAKKEGDYDRWMMFPGKSLAFLPLDILYALVLILCTMMTYNGINMLLTKPEAATAALGVEPLLFALFVTLWDLLFLGIKKTMRKIVEDAKSKVASGR